MKRVFKFELKLATLQDVMMQEGAIVQSIEVQKGVPYVYALVDPSLPKKPVEFFMFGTGHEVPDGPIQFIDSFQLSDGQLVFHVYLKLYI